VTTEAHIKELANGLTVDEIVYLVNDEEQVPVKTLCFIEGVTLADVILMYLRDGYTAIPF